MTRDGALADIRILDLSRILAGPTCTQLLGDLGAEVIKVEKPGSGDDTRRWGPPFLAGMTADLEGETPYFLSSNRNKRSVTLDLSRPQGREALLALLGRCDVMVENFKVGSLAKLGLGYGDLRDQFPRLVYCSITGFGQTGPYASRAGYDFLAQAMGGIMSLTGDTDGPPMKVGVGVTDVMTGIYAAVAILAALRHRDATGEGQAIDLSLLDVQVAWLVNEGLNYLVSREVPQRRGNSHPNIVPYQAFPAQDGWLILAVGNDAQFRRFCGFSGRPRWADDERFATNPARVENRDILVPMITDVTRGRTVAEWVKGLEAHGVPCAPVNDVAQAFADPQVIERGMRVRMPYPQTPAGAVELIGNPLKLSRTAVSYRQAPPTLGEHTERVLSDLAGYDDKRIAALREDKII